MAQKYPQPPGDSGSRTNLTDRKGKVDRVEKAYVGIVNVYSLVPKGSRPVAFEDLNIPQPPDGAKMYPQSKPPKSPPGGSQPRLVNKAMEKSQKKELQRLVDQKVNATTITYKWERNGHKKINMLRKYVGKQATDWILDIGTFEQWLSDNPGKISTPDRNSPEVKSALREMLKRRNKPDFDKILNRQAMNLGVSRNTLMSWYGPLSAEREKSEIEARAKAEKRKLLKEQPPAQTESVTDINDAFKNITFKSSSVKEALPPAQVQRSFQPQLSLPLTSLSQPKPIVDIPVRTVSSFEASNKNRYIPLGTSQANDAYNKDPVTAARIVKTIENNNPKYYIDTTIKTERKRKLKKSNMKRQLSRSKIVIKNPKKVSKSASMKKSILKMLVGNRWRIG